MDNDDMMVGRLLSRREMLGLIGVAGAALVVGCSDDGTRTPTPTSAATEGAAAPAAPTQEASGTTSTAMPSCVVRPALTEGPYFVDEKLQRSDIRSDPSDGSVKEGVPLALTFNVSDVGGGGACSGLQGAAVDVWHCDALGVYSDVSDQGFNTVGKKFLRGYQVTDASGKAAFTTIYPGWYQGRATHIHFKIRSGSYEFTSQLFFDDALSNEINVLAPYSQKGASGRLQNSGDNIYQQSGGQLLLAPTESGDGYAGVFDIGLQMG